MKKFILLLLTLITLSVSAQESCTNFFPVASPDGNYIYFSSNHTDGVYHLYRSNVDGLNIVRVTNSDLVELYARLSPDGTKLVFQAGSYGAAAEIYIVDTDGSNLTRLTDNTVYDGMPGFSPDGTKIVFDAWDDSNFPEIFIMDVDGNNRVQLTNKTGAYWQSSPLFNPSGTRIYFLEGFNADNHIVSMNPEGSDWIDITSPNEFGYTESYLNFNPDGSKLVFTTTEWNGYNGPFDVVTCNADGSEWERLTFSTDGEGSSYSACFSADGSKLFFGNDKLTEQFMFDIYVMDSDGSNKNRLISCNNLGVDLNETNQLFTCYPNPLKTNGFIKTGHIDNPRDVSFLLFDLTGKSVSVDYSITSEGISIKRGGLPPGVYPFAVKIKSLESYTGKIVIE